MHPALPVIAESAPGQRRLLVAAITLAYLLVAAFVVRAVTQMTVPPLFALLAVAGGIAAADLASGLVHWAADTWGRDDLPVIGRAVLAPFRIHHVNPDDFRLRRFVDVNGDVALLAIPVLAALHAVPIETAAAGAGALVGFVFCVATMLTNQIHQWAHLPAPPRVVRVLQKWGLLLGPSAHAAHHARPFEARYCITTGWCNGPLDAVRFFRRLESIVTTLTHAQPRRDDRRYEDRYRLSPQADG